MYTPGIPEGECSEEESAIIRLFYNKYWKMLSERIEENKFYKYFGICFIKLEENANLELVQKRICQLIHKLWNGLKSIF